MKPEFEIGKTYVFETLDIRQNSIGNNYIALRFGDRDTYRVKPLPLQEEENLPRRISCKVVKLDPFTGFPHLTQDMYKFYSENYQAGEEYAFKIIAVETDQNSQTQYYQLRDKFGITSHRLYFKEQKYDIEEVHCFQVKEIDEKGLLILKDVSRKAISKGKEVNTSPAQTKETPKGNSFGEENQTTEFKSSLVFAPGDTEDPIDNQIDKQVLTIVKTIVAFMNADGGKLYIGINNNGYVCGINDDFQHLNAGNPDNDEYLGSYKSDTDSYELKIRNAVRFRTHGNLASSLLTISFNTDTNGMMYCCVEIKPSKRPVFINNILLYVRMGNQKVQLKDDEITYFISERMKLSIKDVFDDVDFSDALSKEDFEDIIKKILKEQKSMPVPAKTTNITVPQPAVHPPVVNDDVWNHFTWYKDGSWSFQKDASNSRDVYKEVCVHKSEKDGRILMCYDNGFVNVLVPSTARSKKIRGKIYANGWNTKAELLAVYVTHPMHLLCAFSEDPHGIEYVKVHSISDFSPIESLSAKGLTFINPKLGKVKSYKVISIDYRHNIADLICNKSQTSSTLGTPTSSPTFSNQIDCLR